MNIRSSNQHVGYSKSYFKSLISGHRPVVEVGSYFIYTVKRQFATKVEINMTEMGKTH